VKTTRSAVRLQFAALIIVLLAVLAPATSAGAGIAAPTGISVWDPQPGYRRTVNVYNVDWSKGPIELHAFGDTRKYTKALDFYRATLTLPTKSGLYLLWATQGGRRIAENYLWVPTLNPQIQPSIWWGHVGDTVTFRGTSYRPGEMVKLLVNGVATGVTFRAGNSGPFYYENQGQLQSDFLPDAPTLDYVLPERLRGTSAQFTVVGTESGVRNSVWITTASW